MRTIEQEAANDTKTPAHEKRRLAAERKAPEAKRLKQTGYKFHPATASYPEMTGSPFERIKDDLRDGLARKVTIFENKILDGRATYRAYEELGMTPAFEFLDAKDCPDPVAFVRSRNSVRRQLGRLQRACVAVLESELTCRLAAKDRQGHGHQLPDSSSGKKHEGEWATQAAKAHGAGINAVRNMARILKSHPDVFDACWKGILQFERQARHIMHGSPDARAKVIEEMASKPGADPLELLQKYARTHTKVTSPPCNDRYVLHRGDCETTALTKVERASVDLLLTDAPWLSGDAHEAAQKLAKVAMHVLKPGKLLAVMVGNTCTYTFDDALRKAGMFPFWCIAYFLPNANNNRVTTVLRSQWKPILLYTAHLVYSGPPLEVDVVRCPKQEKGLHPWQQTEGPFRNLVELLSQPGDLVLDPFMGSGTTGAAALKAGRNFIGVERDEGWFNIAAKRLGEIEVIVPVAAE